MKEATRMIRKAHARRTSSETTTGCSEYAIAKNQVTRDGKEDILYAKT